MRLLILSPLLCAIATSATAADTYAIDLDTTKKAAVFEGLGALSAGASSRLLPDYPEPQRKEILDLLFKPRYGASLQHLKVEIGGDGDSGVGCEPSHMRTRSDVNFTRGYEWWLMVEARKRKPAIFLDTLAWTAPGWIGEGKIYSQDMADYVATFIEGTQKTHGLTINYTGIWNERPYDANWIKVLRRTLDAKGLKQVQIVAADEFNMKWRIADDAAKDPELNQAIAVFGEHYPLQYTMPTAVARASGKRLWSSEDGPWSGTWEGAGKLAKMFNRNWIMGGMTKTISWSLISSYYDHLPMPGSGLMKANTPWSGYYEVQPAVWSFAHTTQFTEPGWRYLDGNACGMVPDNNGSIVSLVAPDGKDVSIVAETIDRNQPLTLNVQVPAAFAERRFHIWRSNATAQFIRVGEQVPVADKLNIELEANGITTISTTTGQKKAVPSIPEEKSFPSTYQDDFEARKPGQLPRYSSDQGGIFEVAKRTDGKGRCLQQVIGRRPIEWIYTPDPVTFLGDPSWVNQTISVQARFLTATADPQAFVAVLVRVVNKVMGVKVWNAHALRLYATGNWELRAGEKVLAQGHVMAPGDTWHRLQLKAERRRLIAHIDHTEVVSIESKMTSGMVGLGSGWHQAQFDDLSVSGKSAEPLSLAGAHVTASSSYDNSYQPALAVDGNPQTRWNSAENKTPDNTFTEEWLAVELTKPTAINGVRCVPFLGERIKAYRVQVWAQDAWKDVVVGKAMGTEPRLDSFPTVTTTKVRLLITEATRSVSFCEFQMFNHIDDAP
ncbi:MAG: discoidin domain-containing protein [Verrucomicrobia bacterium]|nr:discoidin domain-containing protein [Verrucomicrobiota bacterium]